MMLHAAEAWNGATTVAVGAVVGAHLAALARFMGEAFARPQELFEQPGTVGLLQHTSRADLPD
jgi:hypothetical protein